MICPHCGNKAEKDDVFCGNCGEMISSSELPVEPEKTSPKKGCIVALILVPLILIVLFGALIWLFPSAATRFTALDDMIRLANAPTTVTTTTAATTAPTTILSTTKTTVAPTATTTALTTTAAPTTSTTAPPVEETRALYPAEYIGMTLEEIGEMHGSYQAVLLYHGVFGVRFEDSELEFIVIETDLDTMAAIRDGVQEMPSSKTVESVEVQGAGDIAVIPDCPLTTSETYESLTAYDSAAELTENMIDGGYDCRTTYGSYTVTYRWNDDGVYDGTPCDYVAIYPVQ